MSEQAPRSNPRLDNFEANKAAAAQKKLDEEQRAYEDALYGEAGQGDDEANYTDEAFRRINEANEFEQHMERMANETRTDYDRGLDRLESGEDQSRAFELEKEEAYSMHEDFEARKAAEAAALEAKFASEPSLRQMDRISQEIENLRNKVVDEETFDADVARRESLEDRLNDLLAKYENSSNYDEAVANMLIDRNDPKARERAGKNALAVAEAESDRRVRILDGEEPIEGTPTENKLEEDDDDEEPIEGGPTQNKLEEDDDEEPIEGTPTTNELDDDEEPIEGGPTTNDLDDDDEEPITGAPTSNELGSTPVTSAAVASRTFLERMGDKYRGNKKQVRIALGAVALFGGALLVAVLTRDTSGISSLIDSGLGNGGGPKFDPNLLPQDIEPVVPPVEFSDAARTVTEGEGWLSELAQLNIPASERYGILDKILSSNDPSLQEWVYRMDDGLPGISKTGQIPQNVLESIMRLR